MKKTARIFLLLLLCLSVSGCRTRTGMNETAGSDFSEDQTGIRPGLFSGFLPDDRTGPEEQEKNGETGGQTKENPDASRKEYDETRPAEVMQGATQSVHGSGEGDGYSAPGEAEDPAAAKLNEEAEQAATRTVAAEEAEQKGISGDAEEADSAMTYYSVLLHERAGALFECQRLYVYWETAEDHRTVFRTSTEHRLILNAGAYDVSARLLEENLHVDDGWIGRKNPGVIVKAVDGSILGTGVVSSGTARKVYAELLARDGWSALDAVRNKRVLLLSEELLEAPYLQLAAMLMIAKTANPDQFTDVDIDQALEMLGEEATGGIPSGIYYFNGQGGF